MLQVPGPGSLSAPVRFLECPSKQSGSQAWLPAKQSDSLQSKAWFLECLAQAWFLGCPPGLVLEFPSKQSGSQAWFPAKQSGSLQSNQVPKPGSVSALPSNQAPKPGSLSSFPSNQVPKPGSLNALPRPGSLRALHCFSFAFLGCPPSLVP